MAPFVKKQLIRIAVRTLIVLIIAAIHIFVFLQGSEGASWEIFETRAQTLALSQLEARKNELSIDYNDVVNAIFLLDDALPDGENPLKFRQVLNDLATNTGNSQSFTFRTALPQPIASFPDVKVIPYTITLSGNLNSFINYLNEVQKLKLFIVIDTLNLSGGNNFDTMTMTARIFVK